MNSAPNPKLIRTAGFWGLVAMCINAVIGSGVFLLPHESYQLLGPISLWAPLLFAIPVFILVLCFAEAASHFDQPGGAYLYARTAFGDFVGFETGWMNWLARVTSLASHRWRRCRTASCSRSVRSCPSSNPGRPGQP
jgi:basic amino acid/polyamine antiporter, APA family